MRAYRQNVKTYASIKKAMFEVFGKHPDPGAGRRGLFTRDAEIYKRAADICDQCPGYCCTYFYTDMFNVDEDGQLSVDVDRIAQKDIEVARLAAQEAFLVVPGSDGRVGDVRHGVVHGGCSCTKLEDGKCSVYEDRPRMCQGFICDYAWNGVLPPADSDSHVVFAARKDFPGVGYRPEDVIVDDVGKVVSAVNPIQIGERACVNSSSSY